MKDTIKSPSIDTGIDITKMHGHMTLILTDVHTGEKEVIEEDNMMTNALQEHFKNLGFLNFPNVNQNNMVEELLGGVLGFDSEISENANNIHCPAGVKMTFNGSIGILNNSAPTELGSYSPDESGWQNDGSYIQTYDYTTSQANGTINCVCLTGKDYGYIGEGNSISNVPHNTKRNIYALQGTPTEFNGVIGDVFNVNLSDSSCYTFNVEDVEVEGETVKKGIIRKYRLPITKLNIKGTQAAPIVLSKIEISLSANYLANSSNIASQILGNKLLLWNRFSTLTFWGTNFTQYLWTVTTSGMTEQTITNTTGETNLYGMGEAIFTDSYAFFPKNYYDSEAERGRQSISSSKTIYVLNRNSGSIGVINNTAGYDADASAYANAYGWDACSNSVDGRIITTSSSGRGGFMVDAVLMAAYPTNSTNGTPGIRHTVDKLVTLFHNAKRLYRDQTYIATINNLDTPVVKTAEKTMKVIYRITFDE